MQDNAGKHVGTWCLFIAERDTIVPLTIRTN